ncbi:MAG: PTS glucitol/sorbitol transporter subunit IIA [Aquiluna sp.]|nr:PTS glucitol/sorbitol transporter subunit IIA [Aquiluna sp.]MCF8545587.1 PTS glucitol/sorbitol transporter subunit IIA [Aquiluna sp.]
MPAVYYQSTVIAVGELVPTFTEEGILVFFGESAPEELHEFCAMHRVELQSGELAAGDFILLDEHEFEILAVGSVANENLMNLGHLNLKADGNLVADLPGDVCIAPIKLPTVQPGTRFEIRKNK